jgi:hypothetical protein
MHVDIVIVTDRLQIAKPSQKAILGLRPKETRIPMSCEFAMPGVTASNEQRAQLKYMCH